jgi:hypothetical protein
MELLLGRFGDRRLEKGGRFLRPGLLSVGVAVCAFVVWGGTAPVRFGSLGFFATRL